MKQPLDPSKAAFYGQFVAAAYCMFKTEPGKLEPSPRSIPDGWELGAWIVMSDFLGGIKEPKFYGMVAHQITEPGNRVIALRGTEGIVEWLDDAASIAMVPFHQVPSAGRVSFGFDKIYATMQVLPVPRHMLAGQAAAVAAAPETDAPPTLIGSFVDQLDQLALHRENQRGIVHPLVAGVPIRPPRPTVVTAHSLGASLATLFVMENSAKAKFDIPLLSTFASPKTGNLEFKHLFDALPLTSWRIMNIRDVVPKLPPTIPFVLDYEHVGVLFEFDSQDSAKANLSCYHNIDTYLHWLDSSIPLSKDCILPVVVQPQLQTAE